MSRIVTGLGVSAGFVVGPVARMARPPVIPADGGPAGDPKEETEAAHAALDATADELEERSERAEGPASGVLSAQSMMARDPALADMVADRIAAGRSGAGAVMEAFGQFRAALIAAGGYLAERAADLDDIRDRTVARLLGLPMPGVPDPGHPFVLVAQDLAPADTATLDPKTVLAIVTEQGGPTSHTAILATSLGIPAVISTGDAVDLVDGAVVAVDGKAGSVVVDPDEALLADIALRRQERAAMLAASSGPGRTADAHPVMLLVNVGAARDVPAAAAVDSEGVGLFRSEFLFLDRDKAPTQDEQRDAYRQVFQAFSGRKVVVRTLDAGADKPLPFLGMDEEDNPALGVRGLRVARRHPDVLSTQLQAIADAAADVDAEVWVMAPMVSTPEEAAWFGDQARSHGLPVVGVMVEVPGAALRAEHVLRSVDFASLGTNDLGQYTMAADRMSGELADLLDYWQPALLQLVAATGSAGKAAGKSVGVCGEMAGDPLLALVLTGLGVTSLSMAPGSVAEVRASLAAHTLEECERLARLALDAETAVAGKNAVTTVA